MDTFPKSCIQRGAVTGKRSTSVKKRFVRGGALSGHALQILCCKDGRVPVATFDLEVIRQLVCKDRIKIL